MSKENTATGAELVPTASTDLVEAADALVEQARADRVELTGEGGLLTGLIQRVLQGALEAEMTEHLGYEPHALDGRRTGNSRNGTYPKTVRTEVVMLMCGCHGTATARSIRSLSRKGCAVSMGSVRWSPLFMRRA